MLAQVSYELLLHEKAKWNTLFFWQLAKCEQSHSYQHLVPLLEEYPTLLASRTFFVQGETYVHSVQCH